MAGLEQLTTQPTAPTAAGRSDAQAPVAGLRPPSSRSQRGLDWFVFFLSDVQTSFVPFVSVYLTTKSWTQSEIGLVLSIGALVALLGQIPGGALVDAVRSERLLAAAAVSTIGLSALVLVAYPTFGVVMTAAVMQAGANCLLGPVVAAISLGLVGHAAVGERLGRNARFTAVGSITAAAIMGAWGYFLSTQTVFLVIVGLCIPAIIAVGFIRAEEIDVDRSHGGKVASHPGPVAIVRSLAGNGPLATFALCALLFHLANAAMMPQIAGRAAVQSPEWATTLVGAYVIVPQLVVAFLAPSVGRQAQVWGRRPLILTAFAALAVRGLLYAFVSDPFVVLGIQVLDGISGAILSVMIALVIADVTRGSGHFNLAVGTVGTCMGIGASLSTLLGGYASTAFGSSNSFLILSAIAMLGLAFAFTRMPETRPQA
jgi:MFS family permease